MGTGEFAQFEEEVPVRTSFWKLAATCAVALACLAGMVASSLVLKPSIALGQGPIPVLGQQCSSAAGQGGCYSCYSTSSPGGAGCESPKPTTSVGVCVSASSQYYSCISDNWNCGVYRKCTTNTESSNSVRPYFAVSIGRA